MLVTGSNPTDGQFQVPVTLTVNPRVSVTPATLSFTHRVDLDPPASRTLSVSTGETSVPVSALASTVTGGSWLNVVPASGNTPATFTVSIIPAGLTPGTYTGSINISATDPLAGQVQVPVTLTVAGAMDPVPTPASLSFVSVNRTPPPPQQLTITRPDSEALDITAQTITPLELPWVQISLTPPGSTETVWSTFVSVPPGPLNVVLYTRADPARVATLPFGSYSGRVRITTATDDFGGSESKPIARAASADHQVGERTVDVPVTLEIVSAAISVSAQCPSVAPGVPFVMPVTVMGGRGTYTLTLTGPSGIALSATTGPASATPFVTSVTGAVQTAGVLPITITARDSFESTPAVVSCNINSVRPEQFVPPISFSPGANCPASDLTVGAPFSATLSASGGTGSFDFSADNLPPGLLMLGNTITGAPNTAGTYSYTIQASSGPANPVLIRCTVRVQPGPLQIRTGCPTSARQGESYSFRSSRAAAWAARRTRSR